LHYGRIVWRTHDPSDRAEDKALSLEGLGSLIRI